MSGNIETRVIGFFAYTSLLHCICDGDACVVVASKKVLRNEHGLRSRKEVRIRKTNFGEILQGLSIGAAYAFDRTAFLRFRRCAEQVGLGVEAPGTARTHSSLSRTSDSILFGSRAQ